MSTALTRRRVRLGALLAGLLADAYEKRIAIWAVAAITAASRVIVIGPHVRDQPSAPPPAHPSGVDLES